MRGTGEYLNYFIVASLCMFIFFVSVIIGMAVKNAKEYRIYIEEMTFGACVVVASSIMVVKTNLRNINKYKKERKRLLADFADKYGYIEEYVELPNSRPVFQLPMFREKGFKDVVGCITIENEVCTISVFDYMYALRKDFFNQYFYSFFYIESKSVHIPSFTLFPVKEKKIQLYEQQTIHLQHKSFNKHFVLLAEQPHIIEKWFNRNILNFLVRDKGIFMQTTPKGLLVWRTYLQYDEDEIMEFILRYVYFFNLLLEGLQKVEEYTNTKTE